LPRSIVAVCGWTEKSLIFTIKATTGARVDVVVEDVEEDRVCVEETAGYVVPAPKDRSSTQPEESNNRTRRTETRTIIGY
jgi:hypothetical protein